MKNTGICPKCHSSKIIRIPGSVGGYGAGNNILAGHTIFSAVKVTRYLCASCGYTEEWIDDANDIEKLKKFFSH
jgi:ribosomal protein S27AE